MKFGRLNFDKFIHDAYIAENSKRVTINVGDAMQMMAIDEIYKELKIPEDEIIDISLHELETYNGEYIILPINWLVSNNTTGHDKLFNISHRIVPVYLGISISSRDLSQKHLSNLKRYEPIGCRDERTLNYLRSEGVDCYLNGCIATLYGGVHEYSNKNKKKSIFFVDVPKEMKEYIPEEILPDIRFFSQEIYASPYEIGGNKTPSEWAVSILETYKKEASMIVTSRFHGAVIGLALGIPVIVTLENYTYRFSWLKKILPLYTSDKFSEIDWNPKKVDTTFLKDTMLSVAVSRVQDSYNKYFRQLQLSEYLENLNSDVENETNQTLYYKDAIKYINTNWSKENVVNYAFWGINDNTKIIYDFIIHNYPKARLVAVYDMFKDIMFENVHSVPPDEIEKESVPFIFVTSYIASMYATTFFEKKEISSDNYFLCQREFLSKIDLKGE